MKRLFKRLFKTELFRRLICWLAANYIRFVHYSSRRNMVVDEGARPYMEGRLPAMFAFWHGRLLMMPMIKPRGRRMHVMISTHRDGEMIARTMHNFGFGTVRGSTTRGGMNAGKGAVKALLKGDNVSVTPDGPKGPAMTLQPGLITIAHMAHVPVVPVTYAATRHKRMKTWDRFMLALPFGRLYYRVGSPQIHFTQDSLQAEMIRLTEETDKAAGL